MDRAPPIFPSYPTASPSNPAGPRWACSKGPPSIDEKESGSLPLCLTVTASDTAGFEKTPPPLPSRSMCLSSPNEEGDPPMWCYNRVENDMDSCSYYMWWSPCNKCGTAWRLFNVLDDDQSFYKLPTSLPEARAIHNNTDDYWSPNSHDWLGWDEWHSDGEWRNMTLTIQPCADPSVCWVNSRVDLTRDTFSEEGDFMASCDDNWGPTYWPDSGYYDLQPTSDSSGNDTGFEGMGVLLILGIIVVVVCVCGLCLTKSINNVNSRSRGQSPSGGNTMHNTATTYASDATRHLHHQTHAPAYFGGGGGFDGGGGGGFGGGGGGGGGGC